MDGIADGIAEAFNCLIAIIVALIVAVVIIVVLYAKSCNGVKSNEVITPEYKLVVKDNKIDTVWIYKKPK